jgi:hypothetical protein
MEFVFRASDITLTPYALTQSNAKTKGQPAFFAAMHISVRDAARPGGTEMIVTWRLIARI